ncbi:hypothetical protein [Kribbella sp. NPDC000426]|uniref:hypothetical protein n=1 Tax=Kribbella sp. NPDC000426 TaxID=3154255 RepID=UPI0033293614
MTFNRKLATMTLAAAFLTAGSVSAASAATTAAVPGDVYTASGYASLDGTNYKVVASLTLPAGKYLINGVGNSLNQQAASAVVSCNMYDDHNMYLTSGTATLPAPSLIGTSSYASTPFLTTANLAAGGRVRVECIVGNAVSGIQENLRLTALTVGDINSVQ